MDTLSYLRELDLFDGLSDADLEVCKRSLPMYTVETGRMIYAPTDADPALHIVKKGTVRLYRVAADGREVTLGTLEPGWVFGTMPMLGAVSRNTYAQAATDALICTIGEDELAGIIARHPSVGVRLLGVVGKRLAAAEDQIEDLAFRTAEQRVARSVVRMLGDGGKLNVSHAEIAKQAGVARETATKILGGMERRGWIKTGYRKLRVLERSAVEAAAAD